MASGSPVVQVLKEMPTGSDTAMLGVRQGGATPKEQVYIFKFAEGVIRYRDFLCRLEGYDGGGLSFELPWSAETASSGVTRWGLAVRRFAYDAEDLDASHTYDFNDVDDTAASASGEPVAAQITFTHGSDMDGWVEGELAIVRVRRNGSHGNDNMSGDAELWGLLGLET